VAGWPYPRIEAEASKGTEVVPDPDDTEDVPAATQAQCRTQSTPASVVVDPAGPAGAVAWIQAPRCKYSTWSPELNVPTVPTAVHERALTQLTLCSWPPPVGVGTPVAVVQEDPFQLSTTLL
jgi:hypothetical protein